MKAEHAPYIVQIGQRVQFTGCTHVPELAGKMGIVAAKGFNKAERNLHVEAPIPDNMCIRCADPTPCEVVVYLVNVVPPVNKLPTSIWCWRIGFKVL